MTMLLALASGVAATAPAVGSWVKCDSSPFGPHRNAIARLLVAPAGAAITKIQGCPRQLDNSTPASDAADAYDIASFNAIAGLPAPVNDTFTTAGTGGTLVHSTTYYYRVAAVTASGKTTLASTETSLATGANGSADTSTLTVKWHAVAGTVEDPVAHYKVYGRSTGAELFMATVDAPTLQWVDTGAVTPAGALPVVNTTIPELTRDIELDYWIRYNITTAGTGALSLDLKAVQ